MTRTALLVIFALFSLSLSSISAAGADGCNAIKLARHKNWNEATKCASLQKNDSLLGAIQWLRFKSKNSNTSFEERVKFIEQNPTFPDLSTIKIEAEESITPQTSKKAILSWFDVNSPLTESGAMHYFRALEAQDWKVIPGKSIKEAWVKIDYNAPEAMRFLLKYKGHLTQNDHLDKINYILSKGAKRVDSHLTALLSEDQKKLVIAKLKLANGSRDVDGLLRDIPISMQKDPLLLSQMAIAYRKDSRFEDVADIFINNPDSEQLKSDKMFKLRSLTALELTQLGKHEMAYKVISVHASSDPVNYVDAEWFAGMIINNKSDKFDVALQHFKNILNRAKFSFTLAKAHYWSGRMAEGLRLKKIARDHYSKASIYPDTYYGQLALIKLNPSNPKYSIKNEVKVTDADMAWFESNKLIKIANIFVSDNQFNNATKFIKASLKTADTPGKKLLIAKFGTASDVRCVSVIACKDVARSSGMLILDHAYPVLPYDPHTKDVEKELMLSIIRQESEFNPQAYSSAKAMGLMQIIHGTSKEIQKDLNHEISNVALLANPDINVKFGSYYLGKLLKRFDGSYVLAIASYNAGPHRVDKWIDKYGDPRKLKTAEEVADWIETIPFSETRSYVQHVLSNLQIYRNILRGSNKSIIKVYLNEDLLRSNAA